MNASVFYSIIAPIWKARGRPSPTLNRRRWFRWEVVRETRPVTRPSGIVVTGYEHVGWYWTWRAAHKAAWLKTEEHR